jgi:hypothetical protein
MFAKTISICKKNPRRKSAHSLILFNIKKQSQMALAFATITSAVQDNVLHDYHGKIFNNNHLRR